MKSFCEGLCWFRMGVVFLVKNLVKVEDDEFWWKFLDGSFGVEGVGLDKFIDWL